LIWNVEIEIMNGDYIFREVEVISLTECNSGTTANEQFLKCATIAFINRMYVVTSSDGCDDQERVPAANWFSTVDPLSLYR
jgi:hypothetical protein